MTIKHIEETKITELGDNKVMKQSVDDAFIDAFIANDVKPNFLYDGLLYLIRIICAVCGFVSYFMYKDYFSGKEMIALLCALYYILVVIDYAISYTLIKDSFLIGSLPSGSKYCNAKDFRAASVHNFGDYDYKLNLTATVNGKLVEYNFTTPISTYFTAEGVLCRSRIEVDTTIVMESFREELRAAGSKKNN